MEIIDLITPAQSPTRTEVDETEVDSDYEVPLFLPKPPKKGGRTRVGFTQAEKGSLYINVFPHPQLELLNRTGFPSSAAKKAWFATHGARLRALQHARLMSSWHQHFSESTLTPSRHKNAHTDLMTHWNNKVRALAPRFNTTAAQLSNPIQTHTLPNKPAAGRLPKAPARNKRAEAQLKKKLDQAAELEEIRRLSAKRQARIAEQDKEYALSKRIT